jgi:hypothetical protein
MVPTRTFTRWYESRFFATARTTMISLHNYDTKQTIDDERKNIKLLKAAECSPGKHKRETSVTPESPKSGCGRPIDEDPERC